MVIYVCKQSKQKCKKWHIALEYKCNFIQMVLLILEKFYLEHTVNQKQIKGPHMTFSFLRTSELPRFSAWGSDQGGVSAMVKGTDWK